MLRGVGVGEGERSSIGGVGRWPPLPWLPAAPEKAPGCSTALVRRASPAPAQRGRGGWGQGMGGAGQQTASRCFVSVGMGSGG